MLKLFVGFLLIFFLPFGRAFAWERVDIPSPKINCARLFKVGAPQVRDPSITDIKDEPALEYSIWRKQINQVPDWRKAAEFLKLFMEIQKNPHQKWLKSGKNNVTFFDEIVLLDFENAFTVYFPEHFLLESSLPSKSDLYISARLAYLSLIQNHPQYKETHSHEVVFYVIETLFTAVQNSKKESHLKKGNSDYFLKSLNDQYIENAYLYLELVQPYFKEESRRAQIREAFKRIQNQLDYQLDNQEHGRPLPLDAPLKDWNLALKKLNKIFNFN